MGGLLTAGLRAAESGLDVGFDLTLEASAGLSGAGRGGEALQGLGLGSAEWNQVPRDDPGPSYGAYGSVLALAGRGPTERYLGDFLAASNMEGYDSVRLYSWWLEARHSTWSLRAGALLADEEFATTEGGANFINSAFGWPPFLSANSVNTGPAFYVPALGLRLEVTRPGIGAWRMGVYDGDTFDSPTGDPRINRHGVRFRMGGDQGWFVISEAILAPEANLTRLKAGVWLHTAAFDDVRDDAVGQPFAITRAAPHVHSSNYGAYLAVERTWTGATDQAGEVEVFLRGGIAPADRNALDWAFDAGLSWTGLLPGRPADVASLGLAHASFSPRFAENARAADPASPPPDFEQVIEVSYTVAISERWSLQPDLQYIRHPGGSVGQRNALVFLLRANVSY